MLLLLCQEKDFFVSIISVKCTLRGLYSLIFLFFGGDIVKIFDMLFEFFYSKMCNEIELRNLFELHLK